MTRIIFTAILFTLLFLPLSNIQAQTSQSDPNDIFAQHEITFDRSSVPQWAKDFRRFDIVTFGVFPFSLLFTTTLYDLYLRNNEIGMTGNYHKNVIIMSAGLSLTLALTDLTIVLVKRNKERRRLESMPPGGTYEIEKMPYGAADETPQEIPESPDEND